LVWGLFSFIVYEKLDTYCSFVLIGVAGYIRLKDDISYLKNNTKEPFGYD